MKVGMLWFDNDPKADLPVKVERAASYYRTKYGQQPTLCFVHPSMLSGSAQPATGSDDDGMVQVKSAGVEVRSSRSMLPNHFWIGMSGAVAGD